MQVKLNRNQLLGLGLCEEFVDKLGIEEGKVLVVSNKPEFKRFVFVSFPKRKVWVTYSPTNASENESAPISPMALEAVGIKPPSKGEVRILWIHRQRVETAPSTLI